MLTHGKSVTVYRTMSGKDNLTKKVLEAEAEDS